MNTKKKKKETERPPPNLPEGRSWPPDGFPPPWGSWRGLEGAAFGDYLKR